MVVPDVDNITVVAEYATSVKTMKQLKVLLLKIFRKTPRWGWKFSATTDKYVRMVMLPEIAGSEDRAVKGAKEENKHFVALRMVRPSIPMDFSITPEELDDGIKLSVRCLPAMYYQAQQIDIRKFSVFDIKSAVLECQDFLDEIFIGSLDCRRLVPPHPKKPLELKSYEFLGNFRTRELSEKIKSALKTAKREVYLCGWIGQVVVPLLQEAKRKGVKIRIITKTPAKGTMGYRDKVEAMNRVREFLDKNDIRLVPTCHSRMLIIDDNNIFVGSMDMDSESFDQREECAIWSDDPNLVVKGKACFEDLFKKGKKLS